MQLNFGEIIVHELIEHGTFSGQLCHHFFDSALAAAHHALDHPRRKFDYQHRAWGVDALIGCWVVDHRTKENASPCA
jgi:hypothetical protein